MCGFLGAISTSRPDWEAATPLIRRRGPDSQQSWASQDGMVHLYHARLSITDFDPSAHQPLRDDELELTVVFVGEIYNYLELKALYPDYTYRTSSDTELIFAVYRDKGWSGFSELKGMFCFCLVDEKRQRSFLVRDAVGKKPLFLARWKGSTYFGTNLCALTKAAQFCPEFDSLALDQFWKRGYVSPDRCIFSYAAPVLPGECIELSHEGEVIARHRCEPQASILYEGEDIREVGERIESLLALSIKRRLANNPIPTALLSGGIDSTVVCQTADKLCRKDGRSLRSITLGAVVPGMNDERFAWKAAKILKLSMKTVRLSPFNMAVRVERALSAQDEPLGMISYFMLFELVRGAAKTSRILLTGDGGDEVFLGYGTPDDWFCKDGQSNDSNITCGPQLQSWISPWGRNAAGESLLGHMFTKADRASAEQGVELRCPLLDWDLMSYIRSLPHEIMFHQHTPKYLLKEQLAGYFSERFLERKKSGFTFNMRYVWGFSRYSGLREMVSSEAIELSSKWLPESLRNTARKWKTIEIFLHFDKVWKLLVISIFLRKKVASFHE